MRATHILTALGVFVALLASSVLSGVPTAPSAATHPGDPAPVASLGVDPAVRSTVSAEARIAGSPSASALGRLSVNLTFLDPGKQVPYIPMGGVYDPATGLILSPEDPLGSRTLNYFLTANASSLSVSDLNTTVNSGIDSSVFDSSNGVAYLGELTTTSGAIQSYNFSTRALGTPVPLPAPGVPGSMVFDPRTDLVYVAAVEAAPDNVPSSGGVYAFNTLTGGFTASALPLPSEFQPELVTIAANLSTLYFAGVNTTRYGASEPDLEIVAMNLSTNSERSLVLPYPGGAQRPGSLAFDPTDDMVYFASSAETASYSATENISVISATSLGLVTTVVPPPVADAYGEAAGSLTFDPDNSYLYLTQDPNAYQSGAAPTNDTIVVLNGSSATTANPVSYLRAWGALTGAVYVAAAAAGEGGEIWFSIDNATNGYDGGFAVLAIPPAVESFSASPATFDLGGSASLTARVAYGAGRLTVAYTGLPAGCSSRDALTLSCTPTAAGTSDAVVTVTDQLAGTASALTPITVNPALSATPSLAPATPDVGQAVAFSANPSGGSGSYVVAWQFGDGGSASVSATTHSYSAPGVYTAQLVVQDNLGTAVTERFNVTVSSVPSGAAIVANRTQTDVGIPIRFTALAQNGTGTLDDAWSFNDGSPSTSGTSVSHTFDTAGSYLVALRATDADGYSTSASLWVAVSATPTGTLIVGPTTATIGESLTFEESVRGGSAPFVYAWSFDDGSGSSSPSPVHEFASTGSFTVSVVVTDSAGASLSNRTTIVVTAAPSTPSSSGSGSSSGVAGTTVAGIAIGSVVAGVVVGAVLTALVTRRKGGSPPAA